MKKIFLMIAVVTAAFMTSCGKSETAEEKAARELQEMLEGLDLNDLYNAVDAEEYMNDAYDQAKDLYKDAYDQAEEYMNNAYDQAEEYMNDAQKQANDMYDEAQKQANDMYNDAMKQVEDMKNAYGF